MATIQPDLSAYVAAIQADLSAYVATIQADLSSAFLFNQENVWPIEAFYHTLFFLSVFSDVWHTVRSDQCISEDIRLTLSDLFPYLSYRLALCCFLCKHGGINLLVGGNGIILDNQ